LFEEGLQMVEKQRNIGTARRGSLAEALKTIILSSRGMKKNIFVLKPSQILACKDMIF
jgi:hypothetical protein